MKKYFQFLQGSVPFLMMAVLAACNGGYTAEVPHQSNTTSMTIGTAYNCNTNAVYASWNPMKQPPRIDADIQLYMGESLTKIVEDKKGNLWLGTKMRGVALFNGANLFYFSKDEGLSGNSVRDMAEDDKGNLWLATENGVTKYDGKRFTRFSIAEGLNSVDTWSILADNNEKIWVGTTKGVVRFDGKSFSKFDLPTPEIEQLTSNGNEQWVRSIKQDSEGNIWFGRDGYGVCKYDGKSFTHYTKADGLCSNRVVSIEQGEEGKMWFGSVATKPETKESSHAFANSGQGGLSSFDGETFTRYPQIKGLSGHDIGPIYRDRIGDLWIATQNHGVYLYSREIFNPIRAGEGIKVDGTIQTIFEDREGKVWFGYSNGISNMVREDC